MIGLNMGRQHDRARMSVDNKQDNVIISDIKEAIDSESSLQGKLAEQQGKK